MCGGNSAAKNVSGSIATCNMVGFVKRICTSVARQVSRKVGPLSTSATVATIAVSIKTRETGLALSCYALLCKPIRKRPRPRNYYQLVLRESNDKISRPVSTLLDKFRLSCYTVQ